MSMSKYIAPTYPRVQLKPARHKQLAIEAKKLDIGIADLLERKLKSMKKK